MADDSHTAKTEAIEQLRQVEARWAAIHEIVQPLRDIRTANHFAEQLQRAFGRA